MRIPLLAFKVNASSANSFTVVTLLVLQTLKKFAVDNNDLQMADLAGQGIMAIPKDILTCAHRIVSLDLSNNRFVHLANLSKFHNVTSLQLNSCGLRQLPDELFDLAKVSNNLTGLTFHCKPSLSPCVDNCDISSLDKYCSVHIFCKLQM